MIQDNFILAGLKIFKKQLINNKTRVIFKKYETIDINELSDWNFAQKLLKI